MKSTVKKSKFESTGREAGGNHQAADSKALAPSVAAAPLVNLLTINFITFIVFQKMQELQFQS